MLIKQIDPLRHMDKAAIKKLKSKHGGNFGLIKKFVNVSNSNIEDDLRAENIKLR